jgi:hypothetical protein
LGVDAPADEGRPEVAIRFAGVYDHGRAIEELELFFES